jgi:hypothetical protein
MQSIREKQSFHARHPGESRDPSAFLAEIKMGRGFRRDDGRAAINGTVA